MKLLFDFFPIILFFLSYKQAGFLIENTFIGGLVDPSMNETVAATLVATGVAIVASFIQVGYHWWSTRRFEKAHIISLALVTVLGGITIAFGDPAFIQWKPTALNWLFGLVFLGSMFVGEQNLIERMMGAQITLPAQIWTRLNLAWVLFFAFSGFANLYVAFYFNLEADEATRMDFWVDFKLFGLMGMTILFVILQALYLSQHIIEEEEKDEDGNNTANNEP